MCRIKCVLFCYFSIVRSFLPSLFRFLLYSLFRSLLFSLLFPPLYSPFFLPSILSYTSQNFWRSPLPLMHINAITIEWKVVNKTFSSFSLGFSLAVAVLNSFEIFFFYCSHKFTLGISIMYLHLLDVLMCWCCLYAAAVYFGEVSSALWCRSYFVFPSNVDSIHSLSFLIWPFSLVIGSIYPREFVFIISSKSLSESKKAATDVAARFALQMLKCCCCCLVVIMRAKLSH